MIKRCVLCYHICPDLLLLGKISNIYIEAGLYATLVYLSIIIPSAQWGRRGVYWSHLVPLSVCGQNCVCYSSYRTTSEGVSGVFFFKLKILSFGKFFKFWTLTLSCVDLWGSGYPQNAGVLVVLVSQLTVDQSIITFNVDFCCIHRNS